jgi:hypothetical protein
MSRNYTVRYRHCGETRHVMIAAHCHHCARVEFARRWPDVTVVRVLKGRAKRKCE